jgi:hypothetical protein
MNTRVYAGWVCNDTFDFLCLSQYPPEESCYHEVPTLTDLIADDWQSGDTVSFRCFLVPVGVNGQSAMHLAAAATFVGQLAIDYPAWTENKWTQRLTVGEHDIVQELKAYLGQYAVVVLEPAPETAILSA